MVLYAFDLFRKLFGKRKSVHQNRNDILFAPDHLSDFHPHPVTGIDAAVQRTRAQDKNEILTGLKTGQQLLVELAGAKHFDIVKDVISAFFQRLGDLHGCHVSAVSAI